MTAGGGLVEKESIFVSPGRGMMRDDEQTAIKGTRTGTVIRLPPPAPPLSFVSDVKSSTGRPVRAESHAQPPALHANKELNYTQKQLHSPPLYYSMRDLSFLSSNIWRIQK